MAGQAPLRVLAATAYPPIVASARVRVADFAPRLKGLGVELDYRPGLTDAQYLALASRSSVLTKAAILAAGAARATRKTSGHDLLLVHRLRLLTPFPFVDPPRRVDAYDLDDALFLGSVAAVNSRFEWAKQEARRCIQYLQRARLVLAGNEFLAAEARKHARNVEVLPTCVELGPQSGHDRDESDTVRIGWIGSRTTTVYLRPVLPVIEELHRAGLKVKLMLVGADHRLTAPWIEHHPWSLSTERQELADLDIGIMPLPDSDWARGKCGYKILQYFSAGVPAVASPIGISARLVGTERGTLASTPDQWYSALRELALDPVRRREQGSAGREFVAKDYSYDRWAPELARMMHSLAS